MLIGSVLSWSPTVSCGIRSRCAATRQSDRRALQLEPPRVDEQPPALIQPPAARPWVSRCHIPVSRRPGARRTPSGLACRFPVVSQPSASIPATRPLESYQDEIYLTGLTGTVPDLPTDLGRLEEAARSVMTPRAFDYVAGAAGSEDTARENLAAFRRWRIVPRMLTDVSTPSYSTTVLGADLAVPVMLAPVGVLGIAHPDGESAVARAAAAAGVPMILSTAATTSIEDFAAASADGQRWYQLYWPKDKAVAASLLGRAQAAGYSVLVVTLDTRILAWRPRDLDKAYLPFIQGVGIQNYLSDPAFQAGLLNPIDLDPDSAVLRYTQMFGDLSLTWDDIPFLRQHWNGPIVLKGILSAADALRAADAGVDGIVVSNHGGRQVDGAIAALDALPAVANAVGARLTVLFDSGIRGGADMLKALALGAQAVLLGRPYVYGLALGGEAGIRHVLRSLRTDFELTMRLAGLARLGDLGPDCLQRRL
jgi:lactate 2-monooxygenase